MILRVFMGCSGNNRVWGLVQGRNGWGRVGDKILEEKRTRN